MAAAAAAALALCLFAAAATCAGAQSLPPPPPPKAYDDISSCLLSNGVSNFSLPSSPSYTPLLDASIRNLRFELPGVGKPAAVILPASKRDLRRAVLCARGASLAIRVRSGGHSYEGLSYTTENHVPFAVIDLANLNRVRVDPGSATAWAESGATLGEVYRAYVGPSLPDEFYLSTYIPTGSSNGNLSMSFTGQVLGPKHLAMSVLNQTFPELGLAESELSEVSWLESAVKFAGLSSVADLTNRQPGAGEYAKRKSDYVQAPISTQDTIKILRYMSSGPPGSIQLDPYGGAMARIGSTATPFPHRAGYLYSIQYAVSWNASDLDRAEERIGWLRSFYGFMSRYVSKHPRGAYVNYLDLDLGTNDWANATGGTSNESVARAAASWGERYFFTNFDRLVRAKTKADPENVFNNAQSIPPLRYDREH
ncbi:reticuline oxidase-like [Panicum miliaceum]|uniref:Reticuline oxidase-like n=1 Tax=Panicum miliaceum TaxID=4540 RepID=A0A3L6RKS1_PANMI|nr:reticuline oxidase-like [Panicum miliaceum]